MKNRSAALRATVGLLAAVLTAAIVNQARATVTWSFFETGISCSTSECTLPPQPFIFATLTLPGPISEGSAIWQGFGTPIYTGDEFVLTISPFRLTPAFNGNPGGQPCGLGGGGRLTIGDFDISWSATANDLAISIHLDAINDMIGGFGRAFGPFGGPIATDFILGGCENSQCDIAGFWQSDLAVPEPSSASLVLAGLIGAWFSKRRRRPSRSNPDAPSHSLAPERIV